PPCEPPRRRRLRLPFHRRRARAPPDRDGENPSGRLLQGARRDSADHRRGKRTSQERGVSGRSLCRGPEVPRRGEGAFPPHGPGTHVMLTVDPLQGASRVALESAAAADALRRSREADAPAGVIDIATAATATESSSNDSGAGFGGSGAAY